MSAVFLLEDMAPLTAWPALWTAGKTDCIWRSSDVRFQSLRTSQVNKNWMAKRDCEVSYTFWMVINSTLNLCDVWKKLTYTLFDGSEVRALQYHLPVHSNWINHSVPALIEWRLLSRNQWYLIWITRWLHCSSIKLFNDLQEMFIQSNQMNAITQRILIEI